MQKADLRYHDEPNRPMEKWNMLISEQGRLRAGWERERAGDGTQQASVERERFDARVQGVERPDGTRFIQPATAAEYCDRSSSFRYKIDHDDLAFKLFTERSFEWGGDWTTCKDFQHFELIEE